MERYALSHRGCVRKKNEDTVFTFTQGETLVAMVADGMGGHEAGKTASKMAVRLLSDKLQQMDCAAVMPRQLQKMLEKVSVRIWEMAQRDPAKHDMGTTMTVAIMTGNKVIIGQIGDSRAYLYRSGKLKQITVDHSYVQFLVEKGVLSADEIENHPYRNIITRAVGMEKVSADVYLSTLLPGSVLLLCSDGLTKHVRDKEIEKVLSEEENLRVTADRLIQKTLAYGATDNVSVVLARYPREVGE